MAAAQAASGLCACIFRLRHIISCPLSTTTKCSGLGASGSLISHIFSTCSERQTLTSCRYFATLPYLSSRYLMVSSMVSCVAAITLSWVRYTVHTTQNAHLPLALLVIPLQAHSQPCKMSGQPCKTKTEETHSDRKWDRNEARIWQTHHQDRAPGAGGSPSGRLQTSHSHPQSPVNANLENMTDSIFMLESFICQVQCILEHHASSSISDTREHLGINIAKKQEEHNDDPCPVLPCTQKHPPH